MLSSLTLGTAQFGLEYGINNHTGKPNMDKSIEMLEFAYVNGVKSIDTAIAYGDSESVIGKWIKSYEHNDLYITSKIPSMCSKNIPKETICSYIEQQVYLSIKRMGINKVNNLMLHDYNDLIHYGEIVYIALQKLKERGYIENTGCSIYELESIDNFLKYPFDTIQFPASIFNQKILESHKLSEIKKRNIRTFVRSAFVQGAVFIEPDRVPKELTNIKKYIIQLRELSNNYNLSISEIALTYLINHENVDSIVFGVDSLIQLREIIESKNKKGIDKRIIKSKFSNIPDQLVDPRKWRF